MRGGARRRGIGEDGRKVLLVLTAGSKEDVGMARAFFHDLRARGLGDPLLVVSDGAPGIIPAIEECFPHSARERCLAHRLCNLAAKVPADLLGGPLVEEPGDQGAGRRVLSGAVAHHCPRVSDRRARRLRRSSAERARLFRR